MNIREGGSAREVQKVASGVSDLARHIIPVNVCLL